MADQNTNDITALSRDILEVTAEFWKIHKVGVHLARLGQLLASRGHNLHEALGGLKLADFIRRELSKELTVITHPAIRTAVAVVPASVPLEGDISGLFKKPSKAAAPNAAPARTERFHRGVWLAFTRPIANNGVRTLSLEPRPLFRDMSEEDARLSGKLLIVASDIVPTAPFASSDSWTAVEAAIKAWAHRNEIPVERLYEVSFPDVPAHKGQGTLLDKVLSMLSDEELRLVQLPLSVVQKLMKH